MSVRAAANTFNELLRNSYVPPTYIIKLVRKCQ